MDEQSGSVNGSIDENGTVWVGSGEGRRVAGSWHAGSVEQGVAFYRRRYDDLVAETALLEQRLVRGTGEPSAVRARAAALRAALSEVAAFGDLDALAVRLGALIDRAEHSLQRERAEAEARAARALEARERLAAEAEQLGAAEDWRDAGERMRALTAQWRALPRVDQASEQRLWGRVEAARDALAARRSAQLADLDRQRAEAARAKESLIAEAESLSGSTDWGPTGQRQRALMTQWKTAGRASRDADDALWTRFRAAQEVFYDARAAMFAERDAELRDNEAAKSALLTEAEAIEAGADLAGAQRRLRELQERWDSVGPAPREVNDELEARLAVVADRLRDAADERWEGAADSPFTASLRASVAALSAKVEQARASGRPDLAAEQKLAAQRQWLASAGPT